MTWLLRGFLRKQQVPHQPSQQQQKQDAQPLNWDYSNQLLTIWERFKDFNQKSVEDPWEKKYSFSHSDLIYNLIKDKT